MNIMRRIALVFLVAFTLNAIWEFWHAQFYIHYQGDAITALILLRAAIVDAMIITMVTLIVKFLAEHCSPSLQWRNVRALWFAILLWLVVAIFLEKWALATGRWAYNDMMPIVPFVQTGLTPTIQLALLGTVSWYVARWLSAKAGEKSRA